MTSRCKHLWMCRVPDAAAIFDATAMKHIRKFVAEGLSVRVEIVTGEDEYKLISFEE